MSDPSILPARVLGSRAMDASIVAAISVFVAFLSGAQRWTGFNSPDSEFYASLALFGSDVSDRAIDPAYTPTRLGYIAPVRALVTTLGPWTGFAVWRLLLIILIAGSVYGVVRLVSTRQLATILALVATLNTMVLSYVGNTYLTGSILAATCLLLALGMWGTLGQPRRSWLPAALAGATAGWLVMLNPYALMLGMTMWAGLRVLQAVTRPDDRWRALGRDAPVGITGFVAAFGLFLVAGQRIFPGSSWLGTYLDWNARLDYASFIGDRDVWQRDIALLVPVVAIALAIGAVAATRASRPAVAALVVSALNVAFTAAYFALVPGPWLEAPTYVAKLWPGALIGVAVAFASMVGRRSLGVLGWVLGALAVVATAWFGHASQPLTVAQGLLVAAAVVAVFIVAAVLSRRAPGTAFAVAVLLAVATVAVSAQLLQNGRGLLGIYGQYRFDAAFVDTDAEFLMRSKVQAEEFVLENTSPEDSVAIWTDPDRLTAAIAAMQLWGWYNNVNAGATVSRDQATELEALRPSAIAMYAPSREQVDAFWASLPPWARASEPECTTVPYAGIGSSEAHVCVTHLRWVG